MSPERKAQLIETNGQCPKCGSPKFPDEQCKFVRCINFPDCNQGMSLRPEDMTEEEKERLARYKAEIKEEREKLARRKAEIK